MNWPERMNRKEAARYLTARYFRIAPQTLAKYACSTIGGGPNFIRYGWRTVVYERSALDQWAKCRVSGPQGPQHISGVMPSL